MAAMTLSAIKEAIQKLSDDERAALASWLANTDRQAWDAQIAKDFSPGGAGMDLLDDVDAQIEKGNFKPLG